MKRQHLDILDGGTEVERVLDSLDVVNDVQPVDDALEQVDQAFPRRLHALLKLLQLALTCPAAFP